MMLAGVGGPAFFDVVSGIRCACPVAGTLTGEVLLGAGNGAFVSKAVEDTLRSATRDSWFGASRDGFTLTAAAVFGAGATILLTGTFGGLHSRTWGSAACWISSCRTSGWINVCTAFFSVKKLR